MLSHARLWGRVSLNALLLCLCLNLLFAQSDTASISGFVRDPSRATVPGATVVIRNEATGLERRTTTNESGYYTVSSLPPGFYTVSAESPGFKKFEKLKTSSIRALQPPLM